MERHKKGWFVVSDRDGRREGKDMKRGGLWSVTEMEEEKGKTRNEGWFVVSDRDGRREGKDMKRGGLWSVTEMEEENGKT